MRTLGKPRETFVFRNKNCKVIEITDITTLNDTHCAQQHIPLVNMLAFTDLAIELQIAIWQYVLPHRGIHWLEFEGRAHEAPYVRDTLRFTRHRFPDGNLPEHLQEFRRSPMSNEHRARYEAEREKTVRQWHGPFFQYTKPVTPSVWGQEGPDKEYSDGDLPEEVAEEVAYTRRCRQLSSYTQVATLLTTCHLSRTIALEYIQRSQPHMWHIYRSKGLLHRPRSLDLWEAQYRDANEPDHGLAHVQLVPVVRYTMDLVVLRLHDQHGRPTPMLRQGPVQFSPEDWTIQVLPCVTRIALEWHPRWATPGPDGRDQFCVDKVRAFIELMHPYCVNGLLLYWIVDGIPRPNWERDYHPGVPFLFKRWMTHHNEEPLGGYGKSDEDVKATILSNCDLDLEFEANGRRYYVVFVVIVWRRWRGFPPKYHEIMDGPFIGAKCGGEAVWPEALRAPARFAYEMMTGGEGSLEDRWRGSCILSWEPL